MRIKSLGAGQGWLLQLVRHGQTWSITWNEETGEFLLQDDGNQIARFSWDGETWTAQSDGSEGVLEKNVQSVKLIAVVSADFIERHAKADALVAEECGTASVDPDPKNAWDLIRPLQKGAWVGGSCNYRCNYSTWVRGSCFRTTRSEACWCATGNANSKCSNSCCWGCCGFMSSGCDCGCLIPQSDYFCACGRNGFRCYNPS